MFDLEQQVRAWHASLAGKLGDRPDAIDELESHLRDDFERLVGAGKSREDAWAAALRQLGDPRALASEFAKVARRPWVPAWVAGISLALCFLTLDWFIASRLTAGRIGLLLAFHIVCVTTGYLAASAVGFLALWAVLVHSGGGWNDRQTISLRRAGVRLALLAIPLTAAGILLGAWWSHGNLGRWWGWDAKEIGGLSVLAWSGVLWQCFRSRRSTPSMLMLIGVMGNIVVCLSWFGPGLVAASWGTGGRSVYGMVVGAFLISQFLAVYVAMLPGGWLRVGEAK